MPLLPGAEPFRHDGGPIGALLCHGFTGSPASLRPWAEFLADAGLSVALPRLPGHGSRWQDLAPTRWPDWYGEVDRALSDLRGHCDAVVVMGLSMGATLALRLAQQRPAAVDALVLVNPSLLSQDRRLALLRAVPAIATVRPTAPGIGGDIKKPGVSEGGYDRTPLRALRSLTHLWSLTRAGLPGVRQPTLVFRSAVDHVVEASNTRYLIDHIGAGDVTERVLPDSYHVATLDNDAQTVFDGSLSFVHRLFGAGSQEAVG